MEIRDVDRQASLTAPILLQRYPHLSSFAALASAVVARFSVLTSTRYLPSFPILKLHFDACILVVTL